MTEEDDENGGGGGGGGSLVGSWRLLAVAFYRCGAAAPDCAFKYLTAAVVAQRDGHLRCHCN